MILDFANIKENSQYNIKLLWAKNTILPLLFLASWLSYKFDKNIIIENVSILKDIKTAIKFLEKLWVNISQEGDLIKIKSWFSFSNSLDIYLYSEFRYSILSLWLLLSFFNEINIPKTTWWCSIWERKSNFHYDFFKLAWFKLSENEDKIFIKKFKNKNNLLYKSPIPSTSLSENIIIYSVLSYWKYDSIIIENFYWDRPDIKELIKFSEKFWYNFTYKDKLLSSVNYTKVNTNKIVTFKVITDFDQALFYILLSILIKSKIIIENYYNSYDYNEINYLNSLFWNIITYKDKKLYIDWDRAFFIDNDLIIYANEYPNIMSDSQPLLSICSIFANSIKIYDTRFIGRYKYWEYYKNSWYNIDINDKFIKIINNKNKSLFSEKMFNLYSIRESALLLLLAIIKKEKIYLWNFSILERWYDKLVDNLLKIWTNVKKNWKY